MIYYDSHHFSTLFKIHGSIFPKAIPVALLVSLVAFAIKLFENWGYFTLDTDIVKDSVVYSGFSFTLGFILVFRTSESYNRFWVSATSVNAMRTQWIAAASSLLAFVRMSKEPADVVQQFEHKVVRLFSLLHAMSLGAIASMENEHFECIDIMSFRKRDLEFMRERTDKMRAEIVYQWIQALIVKGIDSKVLIVPPPILTRVFQEMEQGMLDFNFLLQLMTIPFPFPYAQVTLVLIQIYVIWTPFVMSIWTNNPVTASIFTFLAIVCMNSINMIATELENPFGDDVNDLPVHEFHCEFNSQLLLLLEPEIQCPPELIPSTDTGDDLLVAARRQCRSLTFSDFFNSGEDKNDLHDSASCKDRDKQTVTSVALDFCGHAGGSSGVSSEPGDTLGPTCAVGSVGKEHDAAVAEDLVSQLVIKLLHELLHERKPKAGKVPAQAEEAEEAPTVHPAKRLPDSKWHEDFLRRQEASQQLLLAALEQILQKLNLQEQTDAGDNLTLRPTHGSSLRLVSGVHSQQPRCIGDLAEGPAFDS
mmetsp:Transcript_28729/g.79100  ORF Transcript_28729/g.79100 Transcript_28729/m.79100 type:complete len:532 (-) Transcript_28729:79-1674(-)